MGIVLWLLAGVIAATIARTVPLARPARWLGEVLVSVGAAALLGVAATALDFGGWREPDWRAGLFAFLGALAVSALFRLTITRNSGGPSA